MPGTDGVVYVDNLRLVHSGAPPPADDLVVNAFADRYELVWTPVSDSGLNGYNVYRRVWPDGTFARLNDAPLVASEYVDVLDVVAPAYCYTVAAVIDGTEASPSNVFCAQYNGLSDDALLDMVQEATFSYFWDYAHPVSGMAREGLTHSSEICASGGTGMGLMAIVVGVERGYITRAEGASRVLQILAFLEDTATRYHGAWAHWINGTTGATIPFSQYDDGGDLVETSYLVQGMLTVRQYFDADEPVENELRARATRLWEEVEWDWYRQYPDSDVLYWHWSPNHGWTMNMPVRGYMEAMITYVLAIASPTYGVPGSMYANGWAGRPWYANGNTYYGYEQSVGPPLGGPLFFTHYSHLGFDPRYKRDMYCNYFENSRNISLIHRAYAMDNPGEHAGYNKWAWGLTASDSPAPWYYLAHSPTNDVGTISPTAALSAMPYTPRESLATLRYFYDVLGADLWGPYGFYDAFNPEQAWVSDTYLAIDQGPIVVMIENYRTGLCWELFMSNPEIRPAVQAMGWTFDGDLDGDTDVDGGDFLDFVECVSGPDVALPAGCGAADLDGDGDVDAFEISIFQVAFTGS
jgi:hypothetical protein